MRYINKLKKIKEFLSHVIEFSMRVDEIKFNQGVILSALNKQNNSANISDYEFKVF